MLQHSKLHRLKQFLTISAQTSEQTPAGLGIRLCSSCKLATLRLINVARNINLMVNKKHTGTLFKQTKYAPSPPDLKTRTRHYCRRGAVRQRWGVKRHHPVTTLVVRACIMSCSPFEPFLFNGVHWQCFIFDRPNGE